MQADSFASNKTRYSVLSTSDITATFNDILETEATRRFEHNAISSRCVSLQVQLAKRHGDKIIIIMSRKDSEEDVRFPRIV